jgi:hypothetical protein
VLFDKVLIVIGLVADDTEIFPGLDVAVNVVAVPPLVATVNGIVAVTAETVTVPIVGASGKAAIFVVPAEASLNLDPANPEALAFVIAILGNLS